MQQRKFPPGKWGLPSGLMELGEAAEETARREVWEETELRVGPLALLGVYSGLRYLCTTQNGDEFYVVTIAYTASDFEGELSVHDGESIALAWVSLDNLPENIARTHREIIRDFRK
jgi:ADP-ribose pyrophosphatase YjhB (NUDIX family)